MYNHNLFYNEKYEIKGKKFDTQIIKWSKKYDSLMSIVQKRFIMGIIAERKINNVLEVGVFNGVSSLCMLKAGLSVNDNFNLYALDLNSDKTFVGQAVNECCTEDENKHYHLNLGKTTFYIENIVPNGIKFDLILLDGAHHHPIPLFDIILILPYTHKDTIFVLHDVYDYLAPNAWGASFIFHSWKGDKYKIDDNLKDDWFSSMGCIKPYNSIDEFYETVKFLSQLPFRPQPWGLNYCPLLEDMTYYSIGITDTDISNLKNYMEKNYSKEFAIEVYNILINNYYEYKQKSLLYIQETRLLYFLLNKVIEFDKKINKTNTEIKKLKKINFLTSLSWWIPIKKLRQKFRNRFIIE